MSFRRIFACSSSVNAAAQSLGPSRSLSSFSESTFGVSDALLEASRRAPDARVLGGTTFRQEKSFQRKRSDVVPTNLRLQFLGERSCPISWALSESFKFFRERRLTRKLYRRPLLEFQEQHGVRESLF